MARVPRACPEARSAAARWHLIRDHSVSFRETRVGGTVVGDAVGDASGSARGVGSVSSSEDPAAIAQRCAGLASRGSASTFSSPPLRRSRASRLDGPAPRDRRAIVEIACFGAISPSRLRGGPDRCEHACRERSSSAWRSPYWPESSGAAAAKPAPRAALNGRPENRASRAIGLDRQECPHAAISAFGALVLGRTHWMAFGPGGAVVQAFPPTERRWNRTIQAEGCSAPPVLEPMTPVSMRPVP